LKTAFYECAILKELDLYRSLFDLILIGF